MELPFLTFLHNLDRLLTDGVGLVNFLLRATEYSVAILNDVSHRSSIWCDVANCIEVMAD